MNGETDYFNNNNNNEYEEIVIEDEEGELQEKEDDSNTVVKVESDMALAEKFEMIQLITPLTNKFKCRPLLIKEDITEIFEDRIELDYENSTINTHPDHVTTEEEPDIKASASDVEVITVIQSTEKQKKKGKNKEVQPNQTKDATKVTKNPIKKKTNRKPSSPQPSWFKARDFEKDATKKRKEEKTFFCHYVADRLANIKAKSQEHFEEIYYLIKVVFEMTEFHQSFRDQIIRMSNQDFVIEVGKVILDAELENFSPEQRNLIKECISFREERVFPSVSSKSILCRPFSFAKFTNERGELSIEYKRSIADGKCTCPLGSTFDGEHFIFSGGDKIFACEENGDNVRILLNNLKNPSAVTVMHARQTFAFLDDQVIGVYFKEDGTNCIVATIHNECARGLAFMDCGILVVCQREGGYWFLIGYDIFAKNVIKFRYRYGCGLPSFMSSHDETLFLTDLNNKCISMFSVRSSSSRPSIELIRQIGLSNLPNNLGCTYPSGVACDSRKEVILVDARRGQDGIILWGNAHCESWAPVIVKGNQHFPYSSQLSISPNGYILVACRHSHCMKIFKFSW